MITLANFISSSHGLFIKGVFTILKLHGVFWNYRFEKLSLNKASIQLFNFSLGVQYSLWASEPPSHNSMKHLQDDCKEPHKTELNVSFPKHF